MNSQFSKSNPDAPHALVPMTMAYLSQKDSGYPSMAGYKDSLIERLSLACIQQKTDLIRLCRLRQLHLFRYQENISTRVVRRQWSNQIHIATLSEWESKFKVSRSKIMILCEKFCGKEHSSECKMWTKYICTVVWFLQYSYWYFLRKLFSHLIIVTLTFDIENQ